MKTKHPDYDDGVQAGLLIATNLVRAGASPDDLAALLDADPATADPDAYQSQLCELRRVLATDGLFTGASS